MAAALSASPVILSITVKNRSLPRKRYSDGIADGISLCLEFVMATVRINKKGYI